MTKPRFLFALLSTAVVSVLAYILLHEGGHALAAALAGAEDIRLSILQAHTWWEGGAASPGALSFCYAAGVGLPVCVSLVGMLFYSKEHQGIAYHLAYLFAGLVPLGSLLVWVVLPLYSLFAPLPTQSEDVVQFLHVSGAPPLLVAFVSLLLILLGVFLLLRKGILTAFYQMVKHPETLPPGQRLSGFAAALLAALVLAVLPELPSLTAYPLVTVTMQAESADFDAMGIQEPFQVQEAKDCHFQFQLKAQGLLADLRILDEGQEPVYQNITGEAAVSGTLELEPGSYTASITYLTDGEALLRHCEEMGYSFDAETMAQLQAALESEARLSQLRFVLK